MIRGCMDKASLVKMVQIITTGDLHQHPLRRYQDIAILVPLLAFVLHRHLPPPEIILPMSAHNFGVELQIFVEAPFLHCLLDIR